MDHTILIFNKNFQRTYKSKENNFFIVNEKVYEYTSDSRTPFGSVYAGRSYQEVIMLDTRTLI